MPQWFPRCTHSPILPCRRTHTPRIVGEEYDSCRTVPDGAASAHPKERMLGRAWSTRMTRAQLLRGVAATLVAIVMLVLASVLTTGPSQRARPPLGEVRIEKIVDFQLPVLAPSPQG